MDAKEYLASKGLNDHDYMDSGMIDHISMIMEEYHEQKLYFLNQGNACMCGSEEHSELIKRDNGLWYCEKCNKPY